MYKIVVERVILIFCKNLTESKTTRILNTLFRLFNLDKNFHLLLCRFLLDLNLIGLFYNVFALK